MLPAALCSRKFLLGNSQHAECVVQEYLHRLEEAKKRDHRLLGMQQELFFFHPLR